MHVITTNVGQKTKITHQGKEIITGIFKYQVKSPVKMGKEDMDRDA